MSAFRDHVAYRLACAALRLGTPLYRRRLRECYELGLYPLIVTSLDDDHSRVYAAAVAQREEAQ